MLWEEAEVLNTHLNGSEMYVNNLISLWAILEGFNSQTKYPSTVVIVGGESESKQKWNKYIATVL